MADQTDVHIGENSPEEVAFKLLDLIGAAERKTFRGPSLNTDRAWILTTYAECIGVVRSGMYKPKSL